MSTIRSTLLLNDKMTAVITKINHCMGSMIDTFEQATKVSAQPFDVSTFEGVRAELVGINEDINNIARGSKTVKVFDTAELEKTHANIVKIGADRDAVINKAKGTELFDTTSLDVAAKKAAGIDDEIEKVSKSTDTANRQQQKYNNSISHGFSLASGMVNKIKTLVAAYAGVQGVKTVFGLSDNLTNQTARLNLLVDDGGSVDVLKKKIFQSAQAARALYSDTMDSVSKLGLNAMKSFSGMDEIIKFSELINKNFKIGGASAVEQSSAMLQLTQAMGSGKLQGDEYRSIIENAPLLAGAIENYMTNVVKAKGSMKEWASEGMLTADVIKAAVFNSSNEIEERFKSMPMTWADIWTNMKNQATVALEPALQKINELANNKNIQTTVAGIISAIGLLTVVLSGVIQGAATVYSFFANNWGMISPIIYGIVAVLGIYGAVLAANKIYLLAAAAAEGIKTFAATVHAQAILRKARADGIETATLTSKAGAAAMAAAGMTAEQIATVQATSAQTAFNASLLASPITWIIIAVIALIVILIIVANKIAKTSETATSAFGVIVGWVYVAGTAFKLFAQLVANVALGIWGAIKALCTNMGVAFHNTIASIKSWFYGLLSCVLNVISSICAVLNKLPFVEFDYSGISSAAADYASKSEAAAAAKGDYVNLSDAFNKSANKYDLSNWKSQIDDSFKKGAAKGDAAYTKFKDKFDFGGDFGNIAGNTGDTAKNTGDTAKSLNKTNEELTWLRDIAEKEAVNRFTTAQVKVDMSGMNNSISSDFDLDGIFDKLTVGIKEASMTAAEGVY